jgi:ATP-dependent RNA helicase DOB1
MAVSDIVMKNPLTVSGVSRASSLLGPLERVISKHGHVPLFQFEKKTLSPRLLAVVDEFEAIWNAIPNKEHALEQCMTVDERSHLESEIEEIENPLFDSSIDKSNELLRELGYLTADGLLTLKGRVCSTLHVEDPLPIVELLVSGFFSALSPDQVAIAVSAYVESPPKFKKISIFSVAQMWAGMKEKLKGLCQCIDEKGLLKSTAPKKRLMPFVWRFFEKKGNVSETVKLFEGMSEGIAVRVLKRIRELLDQLIAAARILGVVDLEKQFSDARKVLTEGSQFDQSLYKSD